MQNTQRQKLVVIGNGMVGQRLLEKLTATPSDFDITVLCEEPRPAYDRVQLTGFFSGKTAEDLSLVPEGFFEQSNLFAQARRARHAHRPRGSRRSHGQRHRLPLRPRRHRHRVLSLRAADRGRDRPDCFVYRTIEDLIAIREAERRARVGVVIGGGLLGLEAAKALVDLGLETHVVEFAPRLMAVQVDDGGGRALRRHIEALGVRVHCGKATQAIEAGTSTQHVMRFADGEHLETDVIVFSAGIRPQDAIAKASGLTLGPRGGIVIDDQCRTNDPEIFAIGECALWQGKLYGLVAPGYRMAEIAATSLRGDDSQIFGGADMSTKLKLMGVDVASLGDAHGATPDSRSCTLVDERAGTYKKLVISADGKKLLGGVLVGDATEYGNWLQMMLHGMPLPSRPESLLLPPAEEGGASAGMGVAALPASAQICSCNGVTKGDICAAVDAGVVTLGAMKKCNKAASSCGGCAQLVTNLIKAELARKGVAVNNHICEHFRTRARSCSTW